MGFGHRIDKVRDPPGRGPCAAVERLFNLPDGVRPRMAIRVKLDHVRPDRKLTLTELADRVGMTIANASSSERRRVSGTHFEA